MSKIFEALRKAEQEPSPLAEPEARQTLEPGGHPRQLRTFEREFGSLSGAVQAYFPKATSGKVILVVGCVDREGASYVSSNLARTMAVTAGAPILYLDGNFHQPALGRMFQASGTAGLSDVFANGRPRDLSEFLQAGDVGDLYLLGTGKRRISPIAFFDSPQFEALLDTFRRTFRFTIVDAAPLLKHPETMQLAARADGVVLVVRHKHLKREVIRKGIETLEAIDAPILGAVLNRRRFAIPTVIYKLIS